MSAAAAEAEYGRQLARNREELDGLKQTRSRELTAMMVCACVCVVRGGGGIASQQICLAHWMLYGS